MMTRIDYSESTIGLQPADLVFLPVAQWYPGGCVHCVYATIAPSSPLVLRPKESAIAIENGKSDGDKAERRQLVGICLSEKLPPQISRGWLRKRPQPPWRSPSAMGNPWSQPEATDRLPLLAWRTPSPIWARREVHRSRLSERSWFISMATGRLTVRSNVCWSVQSRRARSKGLPTQTASS